jgi:hypothetical protein
VPNQWREKPVKSTILFAPWSGLRALLADNIGYKVKPFSHCTPEAPVK